MWLVYHQAFHRNQILTWSEIQPAPWHLKLTLSDPCQFQQKEQWLNMYPQTNLHLRYYRSSWWVCSDDMAKTFADWNLPFITDWRVLKSVPEEEVSWSHSFDASIADESLSAPFIFTIFLPLCENKSNCHYTFQCIAMLVCLNTLSGRKLLVWRHPAVFHVWIRPPLVPPTTHHTTRK